MHLSKQQNAFTNILAPGMRVVIRDAEWIIRMVDMTFWPVASDD